MKNICKCLVDCFIEMYIDFPVFTQTSHCSALGLPNPIHGTNFLFTFMYYKSLNYITFVQSQVQFFFSLYANENGNGNTCCCLWWHTLYIIIQNHNSLTSKFLTTLWSSDSFLTFPNKSFGGIRIYKTSTKKKQKTFSKTINAHNTNNSSQQVTIFILQF